MKLFNQQKFWHLLLSAKRRILFNNYSKHYKNYLQKSGRNYNEKVEGEEEYTRVWSVFNGRVEPYSYRYFSKYMGQNPFIIPEDIGHGYIEFHLNPERYRGFYSDKNIYDFLFDDKVTMPKTILRRINGGVILDGQYETADLSNVLDNIEFERVVLKKTIDSCSGHSVLVFSKVNNQYVTIDNGKEIVLTLSYLKQFGSDWILQEGVKQHEMINFFNETSVNTLRLSTYRSVVDESIHIGCTSLRIGKKDCLIDNMHAGGSVVKINKEDGRVDNKVLDQYGNTFSEWNGIDYTNIDMKLPSWNEIIEFAKNVAKQDHHDRLISLDISIDEFGKPVLIEINNFSFAFWLPLLLDTDIFCGETEQVIRYCLEKEKAMNL